MRITDYISKGTAVARLYKARESLLMDKDCKGLCFYLRSVDILDYLEEIGIWNLDAFNIHVLWAYEDFINRSSQMDIRNVKVVERRLPCIVGVMVSMLGIHQKRYGEYQGILYRRFFRRIFIGGTPMTER